MIDFHSHYGARGDAAVSGEPAPGAAEEAAAQFDTVAVPPEGCDTPVATGVMPTGVCR